MLNYLLSLSKVKLEEKMGQGLTEYAVVVALVVIIAIAILAKNGTLGNAISDLYSNIAWKLGNIR